MPWQKPQHLPTAEANFNAEEIAALLLKILNIILTPHFLKKNHFLNTTS